MVALRTDLILAKRISYTWCIHKTRHAVPSVVRFMLTRMIDSNGECRKHRHLYRLIWIRSIAQHVLTPRNIKWNWKNYFKRILNFKIARYYFTLYLCIDVRVCLEYGMDRANHTHGINTHITYYQCNTRYIQYIYRFFCLYVYMVCGEVGKYYT